MRGQRASFAITLGFVVLWVSTTTPVYSAGFSFFEQGTKAMGMAGAFTAQADDPSAMFHNVAGIAFFDKREFSLGTTLLSIPHSTFRGIDPFPPGSGATGEQKKQIFFPSHFYLVQPINKDWKFGLALNSPFGLTTRWKNPDRWAGRFISIKANLRTLDLNPSLGWQVTPKFGIGAGAIFRFSNVELIRHALPPSPLPRVDVANVRLKSDFETGYGWNVGLLHKATDRFSWGLSYRSRVEIDYSGKGRLIQIPTGNPQLDAGIARILPFNQDLPITTSIKFPDMASLGLAYAITSKVLVETDVNWTGWRRFNRVDIHFTRNPNLNQTIPEDWKSVFNYRAGLRWTRSQTSEWRFGYFFDTTPQPEQSVSPLLPDANRNGFSAGYGYRGSRVRADLALMVVPFNSRTTRKFPGFNGTYKTDVLLFGATLSW